MATHQGGSVTPDDLAFIFKPQLDDGEQSLYYMLLDHGRKFVARQPADRINELLPMLAHFTFDGYRPAKLPRFISGSG